MRGNSKEFGLFYLIVTVLLFSTYEVVSKTLVGKVDPFQINFIRFLTGGVFLFAFVFINRDFKIGLKDLIWVWILGVINVVFSMNLLQLSLYTENAKASVVAVIFSSNPVFVALFAALLEKEKLTLYKIAGLIIGMSGIITIFYEKLLSGFSEFISPLLAIGASVSFALYTVLGRKVSKDIGSLKMNAYSFVLGSVVLLPVMLIFKQPVFKFDFSGIFQVIYLSLAVTGLAYFTYFKGLSIIGAAKGSIVYFLKPVLASILAIVFLGEKASVSLWLGTGLILLGIYIVVNWPSAKKKTVELLKDFVIK